MVKLKLRIGVQSRRHGGRAKRCGAAEGEIASIEIPQIECP